MSTSDPGRLLTTSRACLFIGLIWAGIYLPGLGSAQLKHEEPRRALPAIHMLQTGDWLVPRVGADPYLRKPPLLNWLIALSFRASGGPGEWTARFPSVLAMLALALTVTVACRRWLGPSGALLAAIFALTNLAAMEIGRLAELEALYLSLTGIALVLWLAAWRDNAGPWRLWCAPAPFLALGMLTKGPAHLLFYYGVVIAVLIRAREGRLLRHPAHALAFAIMVAPFLAWAIPCAAAVGATAGVGGVWEFWWHELTARAAVPEGGAFSVADWLWRVPQGFLNFLPWTVLLPLIWSPRALPCLALEDRREAALFQGMRWGMTATFVGISLLPGGSARYAYPLVTVPCLLLARVLTIKAGSSLSPAPVPARLPAAWGKINAVLGGVVAAAFAVVAMPILVLAGLGQVVPALVAGVILAIVLVGRFRSAGGDRSVVGLALASARGMVLITAMYAVGVVPLMNGLGATHPREIAAVVRRYAPPPQKLAVLDAGYEPFWYYLEPGVIYFHHFADLPVGTGVSRYLVPTGSVAAFTREAAAAGVVLSPLLQVEDGGRHRSHVPGFKILSSANPAAPAP